MAVKYRSKKTKKVVTFSQPNPRLERDKRYERVEAKPAKPEPKSDG